MRTETSHGPLERFSAREGQAWGGMLRAYAVATQQLDAELRDEYGLSLSTYEVLLKLAWAPPGGERVGVLAQRCLLSAGGVTRILDKLVDQGFVTRYTPESNRRLVHAEITEEGFRLLQAAQRTHLAGVRRVFLSHCSEQELDLLGEIWPRIVRAGDVSAA